MSCSCRSRPARNLAGLGAARAKAKAEKSAPMICFRAPAATPAVGRVLGSAAEVAQALSYLVDSVQEELHVLAVDSRNRVRMDYMVARGSASYVNIDPSDIVRAVLLAGTRRFVLVHNHPSGDVTASPEDVRYTRRVIGAAKCADLTVLDHVVVGRDYSGNVVGMSIRQMSIPDLEFG